MSTVLFCTGTDQELLLNLHWRTVTIGVLKKTEN